MHKIYPFMAFFALLLVQLAWASDWSPYAEIKDGKDRFKIEYDVSGREIKFLHYRKWNKKPERMKIYPVATDDEVNTAIVSMESYLQSIEAPTQKQHEFLEKLQELRHLNMSQCQVIHFHSLNPKGSSNFDSLLSEVERINNLERMGPESFRSVALFEVSIEEEGDFEIRGVLDKNSNIVKLSVLRKGGEIKDFKIIKDGESYKLISPKGELVFILKPELNAMKDGKILLMTTRSGGVQNVHRTFFNLNKTDTDWKVKSFSPKPEMSKNLSGIPLLRFDVKHEPVLRVNGTESFFKSIDEVELEDVVEKLGVQKSDFDHISKLVEKEFAKCMLDLIMVNKEGTSDEGEVRKLCLLVSEIESSLEIEKLDAARYFEKTFDSGVLINESVKTISEEFRSCISEGEGFKQGDDYLYYNYQYISNNENKVRQKVKKCRESLASTVVKSSLIETLRSDSSISDLIPSGEVFEGFLKQVLNEGHLHCLAQRKGQFENCKEYSLLYKNSLLFSADISHRFWQKNERSEKNLTKHNELVKTYKSCVEEVRKEILKKESFELAGAALKQSKCASEVILGLGMEKGSYLKVVEDIEFFKGKDLQISDDLKKLAEEKYSQCFTEAAEEIGSSLEQFDSIKLICSIEAAKEVIPALYADALSKDFEEYLFSKDQKEAFSKYAARLAQRKISDYQDAENINASLEKEVPVLLAKALDGSIDHIMRTNFSDEENFVFNSQAREEISKKIFFLIGGNSNKPLSYELKLFVMKEFEKEGLRGARFRSNSFLQDLVKEVLPFIAVKEVGNKIFNKADRDRLAGMVDAEMQACIKDYAPKQELSFQSVYKFCEKKRFGLTEFLLAKREFEQQVSHHFTLASDAGNRALSPIHYMKECVDGLDKKEVETGEYEKLVRSCINLTRIKISSNIDKERVSKFKPYMRTKDGGTEKYSGLTSAYCHNIIFYQITKELDDKELSRRIHDKDSKMVAAMLSAGDTIYDEKLMEALAQSTTLDSKWFDTKLKECHDGTHSFLMSGLKNYLIQLIPASMYSGKNRVGQSNKEVLESFLDVELLELLLQLKIDKGDKGGELNSAEKDPSQLVVTSTLTLDALSNFMATLGTYITDGFIYEKDKMKTELVIFREELKNALKWVNNQERPIRIAELGDFFTESNLADHMAQAMVSELVRKNFLSFLSDMEKNELRAARLGSGHTQAEVKAKFVKLRAHTKKMTEFYDFGHIIRPKSISGDRLLKFIKENYLLPKLVGDKVSSYSMAKIHSDVANMILRDSTEGGFAELFVREVAELELTKEKNSHWGITRYLFYDTGDFDWATLRKTKAGKKAIDYYGRNLLLPRMLGKQLSTYEEKLRMNRFKDILNDAIGEND